MNISLTKKQEEYINSQIQSGDFKSANEVVRAALRLHQAYRHRVIEDLRAEIEKGWEGGTSAPVTKFVPLLTDSFSPYLHHLKPYVA